MTKLFKDSLLFIAMGIAAPLYGQLSDVPVFDNGGCTGTPVVFFPGPATISQLPSSPGSLLFTYSAPTNLFWVALLDAPNVNESTVLEIVGGLGPHFEPALPNTVPDGCLGTSQRFFTVEVSNTGKNPWTGFDLELQSVLGVESPPDDGLSFGKIQNNELYVYTATNCGVPNSFPCSTVFSQLSLDSTSSATHPPTPPLVIKDKLHFSRGLVLPGETVSFHFFVTERDPANQHFFLLLTPIRGDKTVQ